MKTPVPVRNPSNNLTHTDDCKANLLLIAPRMGWCHFTLPNDIHGAEKEPRELPQPILTWVAVYVQPVHSLFSRQPNCLQAVAHTKAQGGLIAQLIDPHQRSQSSAHKERELQPLHHHHHDISPLCTAGLSLQVCDETNSHTVGRLFADRPKANCHDWEAWHTFYI